MADDPDLELVLALQAGDDSALRALMDRHREPVFRFLFRYTRSETTARDLAQETFVRAYFKIARFEPRARFGTWLHRIALNLVRDHSRSRHARRELLRAPLEAAADHPPASATDDPRHRLERLDRLQRVQAAIDALPKDLKGALLLTVFEGMSHEEAAAVLDTTAKAIETRIYRARNLLREATGLGAAD
ncbi:MAG: RNA polymerase subunit sigma-24 [Opitutus sp.]|nr:RNA polymerase subunit sigma-24 [Opitutus sp.]